MTNRVVCRKPNKNDTHLQLSWEDGVRTFRAFAEAYCSHPPRFNFKEHGDKVWVHGREDTYTGSDDSQLQLRRQRWMIKSEERGREVTYNKLFLKKGLLGKHLLTMH